MSKKPGKTPAPRTPEQKAAAEAKRQATLKAKREAQEAAAAAASAPPPPPPAPAAPPAAPLVPAVDEIEVVIAEDEAATQHEADPNAVYPTVDGDALAAAMPALAPPPPPPPPEPVFQGRAQRDTLRGDVRDQIRGDVRDDIERAPEGMVRKQRGLIDKYALPQQVIEKFAQAGWSLEWKRCSTFNKEDEFYQTSLQENGWQGVNVNEIPGFMPSGYSGSIVREGLMLMKRPMYLTEEARREDKEQAQGAIRTNDAKFMSNQPGQMPRQHPSARAVTMINKDYAPTDIPLE